VRPRDKTFQSLAMTALVLMIWIGVWEAAAALAGQTQVAGVLLAQIAAAASPLRAILVAADPYRDTLGLFAAADTWYVCTALALAALLNGLAILRLRVWNPGRDVLPQVEESGTNCGAEHQRASDVPLDAEAARAGHVDARVRKVDQKSRDVWDNPVLDVYLGVRPEGAGYQGGLLPALYYGGFGGNPAIRSGAYAGE
jgi:hypothetical protein